MAVSTFEGLPVGPTTAAAAGFDALSVPSGGSAAITDVNPFRGTRALQLTASPAGVLVSAERSTSLGATSTGTLYGRCRVRVPVLPPDAVGMRVLVITDGNGARRCDVRIINTGQIVLGTTAAVLATSTTVVTADQWVDVGLAILVFSSTVGQAQLRIWDSAGNVVETLTSTAAHNTLGSGGLNRVQAGVLRSGIASYTAVLDDVDWSTAGYPTISNSTTAGATLSASSSLTANGAGATAATAVLAAVSDMTAVASANTPTAAHLSGLSAADAAGHVVAFGGAALSVASVLTADAQTTTTAGSDLGATSTLTGAATRALPAAVNLSALPAATATAVADLMAGAGLTAASALTATATVTSTEPVRPGRFTSGTYTTTHTPGASSPLLAASAGRSTLTAGVEV